MKITKLFAYAALASTLCALPTYATNHSLEWTRQLGTSSTDWSQSVSSDGLGNVYISGFTEGSLDGISAGGADAFVAKFSDPVVPEPSTLLLVAMASLGLLIPHRRRKK